MSKVPATSANLGPGLDVLGLSLDIVKPWAQISEEPFAPAVAAVETQDILARIACNENMMILIGNEQDQDFQQLLDAFTDVLAQSDQNVASHIVKITKIDDEALIKKFIDHAYDENDKQLIMEAFADIFKLYI